MDQLVAVFLVHASSVDNSDAVTGFGVLLEIIAYPSMDFIDLLGSCCFAGADCPHWLVSKHNFVSVFTSDVFDGIKLTLYHIYHVSLISLLQGSPEAVYNF